LAVVGEKTPSAALVDAEESSSPGRYWAATQSVVWL
jgi:hypothetical protein